MKKLLATLLLGLVLTVAALPAAAEDTGSAVTMTANAQGASVRLTLPADTVRGVKALRLSFAVESTDPIDAQFDFDGALPGSVQQFRYDPATGRMNIYVAGGSELFTDGAAALGSIRLDAPAGSTATVRLVEDSLELVNGAFGKTAVPAVEAEAVDVTVGAVQTPAPEATQKPSGEAQDQTTTATQTAPTPTPAVTTTPVATAAPVTTVQQPAASGSTGSRKPVSGSTSAAAEETPNPTEAPQTTATPEPDSTPSATPAPATPEQAETAVAPAVNLPLVVLAVVACLAVAVLIGIAVLRFRSR